VLAAVALSALTALLAAAPAGAATVHNACAFNVDGYYRDMDITLADRTAAIEPSPPRYPAPTGTVVDPGQTITLPAGALTVQLPDNLPRFGYQAGLLAAGTNTLNANVWVAVKGTNTAEDVRVVGPIAVTATTTIQVDPTTDAYVSDTGFAYNAPTLPALSWTAVGGDVSFGQAGPGTLGSLPVGPSGTVRPIAGSVAIQANVGLGVSFYMDCQPGATLGVNPTDGAGPTFTPGAAPPFDATIKGPRNVTCLNAQGRLASGAAANLPAGLNREIDPIGVVLAATGNATEIAPGASYTLTGATARITIPADTATTLGRFEDPPGTPLVVAAKSYPLDVWLTIAATNTVERTQTVRVSGTYALQPTAGSPGAWNAFETTVALPATTWTPAGPGRIEVSTAQPGSMAPIQVSGAAATDPLGAPATTAYTVTPYGSVVLRAGTERNATTLDCVPGAISIANAGIGFSNLGRLAPPNGSDGRYAIRAHPRPPVFAATTALAPPAPPGPPAPPPPPPPPPPTSAAAATSGPGKVGSSKLKAKGGRFKVSISCTGSRTSCKGTLRVRSAARLRLTARAKARIVTIARDATYTVAAGKRKTVTLKLSKDARRLLQRRRSLKVRVTLKPSRGAAVTRTLMLSR
jgi:hypothetical protein